MYYIQQTPTTCHICPRQLVNSTDLYKTKEEATAIRKALVTENPTAVLRVMELHGLYALDRADDLSYVVVVPSFKCLEFVLDDIQIESMRLLAKRGKTYWVHNLSCHFKHDRQWIHFPDVIAYSQSRLTEVTDELDKLTGSLINELEYVTSPKDWH